MCAVSGFVVTMTGPANVAFVERVYPRVARGRALGIIRAAGGVSTVAVSFVSGMFLERFGYRTTFAAAAVVGVLGTLLLLRVRVPALDMPESLPGSAEPAPEPRDDDDRRFTSLMVASFIFGVGCWIQVPARTVSLADVVQVTPRELGWLGGVGAACLIACSVGWGRFTDRRSSLDALRLVYLAGAAATVFYLVSETPWGLVGAAVADAVLQSGLDVIWTLALLDVVGSRGAARGAAVSATLAGVRGVLAPLVGAAVIAWQA